LIESILEDIPGWVLATGAGVAVVAHVALYFLARRIQPAFLILGAYVISSPLSAAAALPGVSAVKYIRVYFTLLIFGVALFAISRIRIGVASSMLIGCLSVYAAGALWGPDIVWGVLYKGLMLLAVTSGVIVGASVRDQHEIRVLMRTLVGTGLVLGLLLMAAYVASPTSIADIGRFAPWGINPNRVGQSIAPLAVVTTYVTLFDPSKRAKLFGLSTLVLLGFLLLLTASRGAIGMAAIGAFVVALPALKRPFLVGALLLVLGVGGNFVVSSLQTIDIERLGQVNFDTREEQWANARRLIAEKPIVGHGWVQSDREETRGTTNLLSIYLQVLAETGVVGFACFVAAILIAVRSGWNRLLMAKRLAPWSVNTVFLAGGILASVLAHGVIESGTIMGSTVNIVILGMSAGLIDRLRTVIAAEHAAASEEAGDAEATREAGEAGLPDSGEPGEHPTFGGRFGANWCELGTR
jgi:O-antigen ligase